MGYTDSGVRVHLPLLTELTKNVMGSQNEQALAEMLTNQLLSWFSMDHLSLLSHIADVTGHGYPSGLLMVACKFILTTLIEAGIPFE